MAQPQPPAAQQANQQPLIEGQMTSRYHTDFSGGIDYYLSPRQVAENASPNSQNCDFKGSVGVGNRLGYTQVASVLNGRTNGWGLTSLHTASIDQLVRFVADTSNTYLQYSTGSTWTENSSVTFTKGINIDAVQAGATTITAGPPISISESPQLYTFNGVDAMATWDGTTLSSYSAGKTLLYGAYFDKRLWGVDPGNLDTLLASSQADDATQKLSFTTNGTSSNPISLTINTGSGFKITGMIVFKNNLYIWGQSAIFQIGTTSTANSYSLTLITAAIGCVSHRSICVVENDVYFAADNGVYSLGEVGTYVSVRTTNKSVQIQPVFDALTGPLKKQLSAAYFNYKYHLFYSIFGGQNDSCTSYDIRYQAWQDWRNYAANQGHVCRLSDGTLNMYFIEPSTAKTHHAYLGNTDAGTVISSYFYTKSYDEGVADLEKLFFDSTFVFGQLGSSVNVSVVFDDNIISASSPIVQTNPQGGFGRDVFGKKALGRSTNTVAPSSVVNQPLRLKAKGQKFAVQYLIASQGSWRLDTISQLFQPFNHFKFPSANKLN